MTILGVDPGLQGGIAVLSKDGILLDKYVMPVMEEGGLDILTLSTLFKKLAADAETCYLEHAQAMPGQGVVSMFNYGQGFGILRALIISNNIPLVLVRPAIWKKLICVGIVAKNPKDVSTIAARRLFPTETFLTTARSKKPHLGILEAALIGEWGRRVSEEYYINQKMTK